MWDIEGADSDEEEGDELSGDEGMEESDEEEGEDPDGEGSWGTKKSAFYDADVGDEGDADTSEEEEEEEEVKRLQAKRRAKLNEEDFADEEFADLIAAKKTEPIKLGKKKREVVEEEIEEVEKDVSKMSEEEKLLLLEEETPELFPLLEDFEERINELRETIWPLLARKSEISNEKGLQYLKIREQILTAYCTNIAFYSKLKAAGGLIRDHPVITTLMELRQMVDKMQPLGDKLAYQASKLLAKGDEIAKEQEEMEDDEEEEEEEEDEEEDEEEEEEEVPVPVIEKKKKRRAEVDLGELEAQSMVYSDKDEASNAFNKASKKEQSRLKRLAALGMEEKGLVEDGLDLKDGDMSTMRASVMRQQLAQLEQAGQSKFERAGDDDLPYHINKKAFANMPKQPKEAEDEEEDDGFDDSEGEMGGWGPFGDMMEGEGGEEGDEEEGEDEEGAEFYEAIRARTQGKKDEKAAAKAARANVDTLPEPDMVKPGKKRGASKKIMANKGLMKYRSKEKKNPRVANKIRAAKKEKKHKNTGNMAANMRTQDVKYSGEATGVRKNLVKSVKLGKM